LEVVHCRLKSNVLYLIWRSILATCSCNIVGLLETNYSGIVSASVNGGTNVEVAEDGLVLLGPTVNTLSITAYPFLPGGDWFLGATCPSSAQAQIDWIQKYDCSEQITHFIPKSGSKASISGGPIDGVYLECDPGVITSSFDASASSGPTTSYLSLQRRDGFNLVFTGRPIPIQSASPRPYTITLGPGGSITAYLQSFSLTITPPSPATVSYSFVFTNNN
jgi:hypothetical protein